MCRDYGNFVEIEKFSTKILFMANSEKIWTYEEYFQEGQKKFSRKFKNIFSHILKNIKGIDKTLIKIEKEFNKN